MPPSDGGKVTNLQKRSWWWHHKITIWLCIVLWWRLWDTQSKIRKRKVKNDEVSDIQKVLDYFAALRDTERQKLRSIFGSDIIGPLVVSRNPDNNSELLLSYGDGEKWGMINVGDATSFYNSITNDRIETRVEVIANPDLHFENLDDETSPINVLIGSRKFAEGWNSYRLSVIDLINLGSAKGNLIIQIFGRGVRLREEKVVMGNVGTLNTIRTTTFYGKEIRKTIFGDWKR